MKAVFLLTTPSGQRAIGHVRAVNGRLEHTLPPGLWEGLVEHGIVANGRLLRPDTTPADVFVEALPIEFSGSMLRAQLVSEHQ